MAKQFTENAGAPAHEAIAQRAHEIWETEGRPEGRALEHWFRAISELKARTTAEPKADEEDRERTTKPRTARRSTRPADKRFQPAG
jgi:hypothetical protein